MTHMEPALWSEGSHQHLYTEQFWAKISILIWFRIERSDRKASHQTFSKWSREKKINENEAEEIKPTDFYIHKMYGSFLSLYETSLQEGQPKGVNQLCQHLTSREKKDMVSQDTVLILIKHFLLTSNAAFQAPEKLREGSVCLDDEYWKKAA